MLHRLSRGERVNADIDWPHVIEELHGVGASALHAVRSLLRRAIVHLLKMREWPEGPMSHWRSEPLGFLADAQDRFTPSVAQRIALGAVYAKALLQVEGLEIDGEPPRTLPQACPFSLGDLLADKPDIAALTGAR